MYIHADIPLKLSATSLSGVGSAFCQPFPSLCGANSFLGNEPTGRAGKGIKGDPCGILAHALTPSIVRPIGKGPMSLGARPFLLGLVLCFAHPSRHPSFHPSHLCAENF